MSLTLYGSRGSGSAAIEMALRAAGLDHRLVRASSWEPDSAQDELRQVNPLGQIPTLVLEHDGQRTVLTESAAILIHLGLEHPAAGLLPGDAAGRALHLRGLVYIAANCYSAVSISDFPQQWTQDSRPEAVEAVRLAARAKLHRHWELFADLFGTALHAEPPGALAFLAVVVSQWSGARAHLAAQRPDFHRRLMALQAHPRLAPTLAEHRPA